MKLLALTRPAAAGLVIAALIPATASAAGSTASSAGVASTPPGTLGVKVDVKRFVATKSGTKAKGTVTATLRGLGQMPTTVRQHVTLSAKRTGRCSILTLNLDTLDLELLGAHPHLDKVKLDVTGRRRGGVLGRLFCSLAGAKVKAARAAAASRLNAELRKTGPVRPIAFTVPVQAVPSQAPPATCTVLDLVLGPLHLELLGLIIDLNRVHLTITANPAGGILGQLLCGLAGGPPG